jgi:uncharacterized protein YggE
MATDLPFVAVSANGTASLADLTFSVQHEALTASEAQTAISTTSNSCISTKTLAASVRKVCHCSHATTTGYRSTIEVSLRVPLLNILSGRLMS